MKRHILAFSLILLTLGGCNIRQDKPAGQQDGERQPTSVERQDTIRQGTPLAEGQDQPEEESTAHKAIWLGADWSWETSMEKRGEKLYNFTGDEAWECSALMKDLGLNAARFRVWVDPDGGDCDARDLLVKCQRAKAQGMAIMVDFHYSDYWADPGKQNVPKAWKGHTYEQMREDLRQHTVDVLELLKANGIEPRWAQIGNETTNGLLWGYKRGRGTMGSTEREYEDTVGHIDFAPDQYAGFIQTGHDAVKSVFPHCKTIVHLDNGWKWSTYDKNLGVLEQYDVDYDMVGMSLYPYWARSSGRDDADAVITDCLTNIGRVYSRFGKECMIVETGFEVDEAHPEVMAEGRRLLRRVIVESQERTGGHCRGVFYWEPECRPGQYKLGAFGSDGRPTEIMRAFKED